MNATSHSDLIAATPPDGWPRRPEQRICIVTPGPISSNPRVVKEADALAAAGYRVRVVFTQCLDRHVEWDFDLAATKCWRYTAIRWTKSGRLPRLLRYWSGARQALFLRLAQAGWFQEPIPELANGR